MEKIIKETTRLLAQGVINRDEADKILLGIFNVRHSSLIPITDEKPLTYESGEWDGLRSDLVLVKNNKDNYCVGRLYCGRIDGSEFEDWYTDDDYEIQGEIVGWQKLPR